MNTKFVIVVILLSWSAQANECVEYFYKNPVWVIEGLYPKDETGDYHIEFQGRRNRSERSRVANPRFYVLGSLEGSMKLDSRLHKHIQSLDQNREAEILSENHVIIVNKKTHKPYELMENFNVEGYFSRDGSVWIMPNNPDVIYLWRYSAAKSEVLQIDVSRSLGKIEMKEAQNPFTKHTILSISYEAVARGEDVVMLQTIDLKTGQTLYRGPKPLEELE